MPQAAGSISMIMAEKSKLEWWFTGSILLLAISILGFAYLFWESYLVTKR